MFFLFKKKNQEIRRKNTGGFIGDWPSPLQCSALNIKILKGEVCFPEQRNKQKGTTMSQRAAIVAAMPYSALNIDMGFLQRNQNKLIKKK